VTPKQFAKKIGLAIERAQPGLQPLYEHAEFRFKLGESQYINLHNVYRAYLQAPRRGRKQVFDSFVLGILNQADIPPGFAEARALLMPAVRPRALLGYMSLQARLDRNEPMELAYRELSDDAVLLLAVDAQRSLQLLPSAQLARWGISFEEAFDVALDNLRDRTIGQLAPGDAGSGVMVSAWNDAYDSTRILLPDLAHRSVGTGTPVMMIPTRDTLMVASRHSPEAQLIMIRMAAERMAGEPRVCSALMYQFVGARLAAYEPEDEAVSLALHELRCESLAAEYADQQQQLDKLHERDGEDIFVGTFGTARKDGKTTSFCSWTQGVTAGLLPKTDVVALVRLNGPEEPEICRLEWSLVAERAGHLMEATSHYPPRYFVSTFPEALFDELRGKQTAV
jgi:hypothetical protein